MTISLCFPSFMQIYSVVVIVAWRYKVKSYCNWIQGAVLGVSGELLASVTPWMLPVFSGFGSFLSFVGILDTPDVSLRYGMMSRYRDGERNIDKALQKVLWMFQDLMRTRARRDQVPAEGVWVEEESLTPMLSLGHFNVTRLSTPLTMNSPWGQGAICFILYWILSDCYSQCCTQSR